MLGWCVAERPRRRSLRRRRPRPRRRSDIGCGRDLRSIRQRADRLVVRVEDLGRGRFVTECEQHGHGLRRRAGDVEPADRLVVVAPTEMPIRSGRVHAGHQREERLRRRRRRTAERVGAVSEPSAARLVGLEVVVRQLLDVVERRRRRPSAWSPARSSAAPESVPGFNCALVCFGCVDWFGGRVGWHGGWIYSV